MSLLISGKSLLQWVALSLIAASLSGCGGDDGGSGISGLETLPVTQQTSSSGTPPATTPTTNPTAPNETRTNQPPEVEGTPSAAAEAGKPYSFKPVAHDADDDFLEFTITNKPEWAAFNDETGLLSGTPGPTHVGENENITITVTDGQDTRSIGPFTIRVEAAGVPPSPANRAPTITGTPAQSVLVSGAYLFEPQAADPDGDRLRYSISNRPSWASFNSTSGRLSGTPLTANVGTYSNIVISVNDGHLTTMLPAFSIQVQGPDNRAPVISGTPATSVQATQTYNFAVTASDPDGDRSLVYRISNQPRWATFSTASGILSGTPAMGDVGTYSNIIISVSDGRASSSLPAFTLTVTAPTNRAPTITGAPATSTTVGSAYSFTPSASDPEGSSLGFTIQNRPSWAAFDTATGRLSGTPTATGTFSNIIINVSDGRLSASLPAFTINVTASTGNRAPTISGSPSTSVSAGATYNFQPNGNDPDGNTLTYSVSNRPVWASFDASTGRLSGTPNSTQAGTYSNIGISVSDGRLSASLATFSITVSQPANGSATLSWTPPTQNTDGSTLSNLAGYRVVYGRSSTALDHTVQIPSAGIARYTVTGLSSGTWYFAVKAYTNSGTESDVSNGGSKTIP